MWEWRDVWKFSHSRSCWQKKMQWNHDEKDTKNAEGKLPSSHEWRKAFFGRQNEAIIHCSCVQSKLWYIVENVIELATHLLQWYVQMITVPTKGQERWWIGAKDSSRRVGVFAGERSHWGTKNLVCRFVRELATGDGWTSDDKMTILITEYVSDENMSGKEMTKIRRGNLELVIEIAIFWVNSESGTYFFHQFDGQVNQWQNLSSTANDFCRQCTPWQSAMCWQNNWFCIPSSDDKTMQKYLWCTVIDENGIFCPPDAN